MKETELPCSDCGTELVERTVHTRDIPISTDAQGHVPVAECPACEARYYPEETLAELTRRANETDPSGDG